MFPRARVQAGVAALAVMAFLGATPLRAVAENPHGNLAIACTDCHSTEAWVPLVASPSFRHADTGFVLTGAHATAACRKCHQTLVFSQVGTACQDCHRDPHAGELGARCASCHGTTTWANQRAMFDRHGRTLFPLLAAHSRLDCESCHGGQRQDQYASTPVECIACHRTAFETATPSHRGFSTACADCHGSIPENWESASFTHTAAFPLTGGHAGIGCRQCHVGGFSAVSADCYSCHRRDFEATRDPNHVAGGFSTNCITCHSATTWQGATNFNHAATAFPLDGAHRSVGCTSCHKTSYAGTPKDCYSCHRTNFEGTRDPNHVSAGFATACQTCHTTTAWRPAQSFDHAATGFVLDGGHRSVACASCHKSGYAGTSRECYACHRSSYEGTRDPNHVAGSFPTVCQQCHSTSAWRPAQNFDHARTAFPLDGAHRTVDCSSCHRNGTYAGTPKDCYSCHRSSFEGTRDPNHVSGSFPTTCQQCHSTSAWRPAQNFDHARTAFPLDGAHRTVDCSSCHRNGTYAGTPKDCYSCHRSSFEGTRDPNHVSGSFPTTCQQCHSTSAWRPAQNFDHARTAFPLNGAHRNVECASCHRNGTYAGTPKDCYSCHRSTYEGTRNPNHVQQGMPTACQQCHTESAWQPANFNHSATAFPLNGAHRNVACASCHRNGQYAGTPKDCYSCHRSTYEGTRNPNHVQQGFPTACQQCHTESAWQPADFNHSATAFPLNGAHRNVACASCHRNGQYAGTPKDCYSCHRSTYEGTRNPNHVQQGFPTACQQCHTESAWQPANFNHSATAFPLNGAHRNVACASCHRNGQYAGTPKDCYSCHRSTYEGTRNPNHVQQGFPTACQQCHTESAWQPANFNHSATAFPLNGAHRNVACASCHRNGQYAGTPKDCYSCHRSTYEGTRNPNHVQQGFPTACQQCHTESAWQPANFNHNATAFPLTGAHVSVSCTDCHRNGVYAGTPRDCYACHQQDYQQAQPNHASAGFPTTCQTCHTTTRWEGATFDHDGRFFPIYSGRHRNVWNNACSTCHVASGNFQVFECILCHEHNQSSMNSEHREVNGYRWESRYCYQCHPDGRAGD
ncbi:MAG: hypothetical protein IPJ17_07810 [Holophagales bacterium]|nr:MAG: hypothetical protein IPJ17_07810 [Holophagales bacterium]